MQQEKSSEDPQAGDSELAHIVEDEEKCLRRVLDHVAARSKVQPDRRPSAADYENEMLALRDEIAGARLEDVPPLLEQMERLQSLAAHRRESSEGTIDVRSPYFGHLVLKEGEKQREVLIGRSTYLDTKSGVRIVDWRDAPVSRLFYRYDEGDEYDEVFGTREVNGEVVTRRAVTIVEQLLKRINCPQGSFARNPQGEWRRLAESASKLAGGQGSASRAEGHHRLGKLGVGGADDREDKHLKEITALIDPRQFELISHADSGLVVIQGGAGSGKTTIGLHRLAYLAYQDKRRFRPDRMLVVVFNEALARYISLVLPALEVAGVSTRTYEDWAGKLRYAHYPQLPRRYSEDTPPEVTRFKKHPAMLRAVDAALNAHAARAHERVDDILARFELPDERRGAFLRPLRDPGKSPTGGESRPLAHRFYALRTALEGGPGRALPTDARVSLERVVREGLKHCRDVPAIWSELLSDADRIGSVLSEHAAGEFSNAEQKRIAAWCAVHCVRAVVEAEENDEAPPSAKRHRRAERESQRTDRDELAAGIDGMDVEEAATLDREDDTLLLRIHQRFVGPLRRGSKQKEALVYEHVLIDEAQDLSPVELGVVLDTVSKAQSVTLAGDVAQRLHMDNGFSDWKTVLSELGRDHVEVEPLKLSYRSTEPIIEFARDVLGPLAPAEAPQATRGGVPVELMQFAHAGDAAGFLAEALRELMQSEPRASVALIARYPEQADLYYEGLRKGEVPYLRRISEQNFPFKPGVDVTDVRQVKGLEFDYVVLVEVNHSVYPVNDESRHLLHIAATRAAYQLWILTGERPSQLLPKQLMEQAAL